MSSSQLQRWVPAVVLAAVGAYVFLGAVGLAPFAWLAQAGGFARLVAGVLGLAAGVGGPYWAFGEARLPGRDAPTGKAHLVMSDERGFVLLDRRGVTSMARAAAEQTAGVQSAEVTVESAGSTALRVRARIDVRLGGEVKRAGLEARNAIRQALEQLGGLAVRDALVVVRVLEPGELETPWHAARGNKRSRKQDAASAWRSESWQQEKTTATS